MDHERAVFAGDPGCLGASVEALSFLVCLEVEAVPFVRDKGKDLFAGVWPPSELCVKPVGRKASPQAAAAMNEYLGIYYIISRMLLSLYDISTIAR